MMTRVAALRPRKEVLCVCVLFSRALSRYTYALTRRHIAHHHHHRVMPAILDPATQSTQIDKLYYSRLSCSVTSLVLFSVDEHTFVEFES